MSIFQVVGSVNASILPDIRGSAMLQVETDGDGKVLVALDHSTGSAKLLLDGGLLSEARLELSDEVEMGPSLSVDLGSVSGEIALRDIEDALRMADENGQSTMLYIDDNIFSAAHNVEITAVQGESGGSRRLIMSPSNASDIYFFDFDGTNLTQKSVLRDDTALFASGVQAINAFELGGETFVVTTSAFDNGMTSFRLGDNGPVPIQSISYDEYLWTEGATNSITIHHEDRVQIILSGQASKTLHTIEVDSQGQMKVIEHVGATTASQIGQATHLDYVRVNGQDFVVAVGGDSGFALLSVLPDGRIVHRESVVVPHYVGLTRGKDIELVQNGAHLDLFILSHDSLALTQFRLDINPAGEPRFITVDHRGTGEDDIIIIADHVTDGLRVYGEGGADIIADGLGADQLWGGAGADLFVLRADEQRDIIHDFDISEDDIDFAGFKLIGSVKNFTITETSWGASLRFGNEWIDLRSHDGNTIRRFDVVKYLEMPLSRSVIQHYEDFIANQPDIEIIRGSRSGDVFRGTSGDDNISGGSGDDTFFVSDGYDFLDGGAGRDLVNFSELRSGVVVNLGELYANSGAAQNVVTSFIENAIGTKHDDVFFANADGSAFWGGQGADSFIGGDGADLFYGGAGADSFIGGDGFDRVDYGDSDAGLTISMQFPQNSTGDAEGDQYDQFIEAILGTGLADTIYGNVHANWLYGGAGDDALFGEAPGILTGENDQMYGGTGNDRLFGGGNNDLLFGGSNDDFLSGGAGSDRLFGGAGRNTLIDVEGNINSYFGGAGTDIITDGTGHSLIIAGDGADTISAGAGQDRIIAGKGDDSIKGGGGVDTIAPGQGNDVIEGGADERDVFIFRAGMGHDVIKDYGSGDQLLFTEELLGFSHDAGDDDKDMLEVLNEFAVVTDERVRFDFDNGNTLTLEGMPGFGDLHKFLMVTEF